MTLSTTLTFYLLIGGGLAAGEWVFRPESDWRSAVIRAVLMTLFWPLLLPLTLSVNIESDVADGTTGMSEECTIEPDVLLMVQQVEDELDNALVHLEEVSGDVLDREKGRIAELRQAWRAQARRVAELDRLLAAPGFCEVEEGDSESEQDLADRADGASLCPSTTARVENIRRLKQLRDRQHSDLLATLGWVRELVTMIHLARFSGAPAARAEALVAQIAAAVEGLSEVQTWTAPEAAAGPEVAVVSLEPVGNT